MRKSDDIEQLKDDFCCNQLIFEEVRYSVGEKLLKIRKSKDFTQQEVADIIGISRSALSYYEKGERSIDIVTLYKLCHLYKVSVDYLLGIKDTPDTQYDYDEKMKLVNFGLEEKALEKVYGNEDALQLINDLVLHPDFQELEYLTHHSRYTRYESLDNGYRSFLTSKLLYSMISEIYEEWYAENNERIKTLTTEEKQMLVKQLEDFKIMYHRYNDALDNYQYSTDFNKTELFLENMYDNMHALYRKLSRYL